MILFSLLSSLVLAATQPVDRYSIYEAAASELTCDPALYDVTQQCTDWATKMNSMLTVVELAQCPEIFVICDDANLFKAPALAIGYGKFHDATACVGPEVSNVQTFTSSTTKDCNDATYLAMKQFADWGPAFSQSHPLKVFTPSQCDCAGSSGKFTATCKAAITYLDCN